MHECKDVITLKTLDFPGGSFLYLIIDVNNHELSKLDNRLGNHW